MRFEEFSYPCQKAIDQARSQLGSECTYNERNLIDLQMQLGELQLVLSITSLIKGFLIGKGIAAAEAEKAAWYMVSKRLI